MFVSPVSAPCWVALAARILAPPAIAADGDDPSDSIAGAVGTAATPHRPVDTLGDSPRPQRLGAKILYVNFDGGDMNFCGNDSPQDNCSTIFGGTILPYSGDAAKRASVIQVIRKRVEDFGITVTDTRPAQGDYDMEMVGNWQGEMPGFAGVAPNIDCFDETGGEVSFTLESSGTADGIAEIVLQEAAHTWGLEHVNEGTDLLYPTTSGSNKTFVDECYKIVQDTLLNEFDGYCNQVHTQFCDSGWQNSHQELLLVFGASIPDVAPPSVEITAPEDGAVIDGDFELVVDIADDQSPVVMDMTITITSPALPEPVPFDGAYAGPTSISFPIDGLPDGEYTIHVDGVDESGNPASDEIAVTVSTPGAEGTTTAATGADGTGDDSDGATDPSGAGTEDPGTDAGTDADGSSSGQPAAGASESGCACAHDSSAPPTRWLPLVACAWLLRRRRPTAARPEN
jgi:hypothetical protein